MTIVATDRGETLMSAAQRRLIDAIVVALADLPAADRQRLASAAFI